MKAFGYNEYGAPTVLALEEMETPAVGDDEVLVRVRATSANPADWHMMRGEPYVMRLGFGLPRPSTRVLGMDLAGEVESVGRSVTRFHPGDEVYGTVHLGSFAEYRSVKESELALKPSNLSMAEAAAVPLAATTALQGLRLGHIAPGSRVLVNGASGGVGTFAVQIAKALGAEVTGVCSTKNLELVRSLGADHVVDYTYEDFTRRAERYDLSLDCISERSLGDCARVLAKNGTYVSAGGGGGGPWMGPLLRILRLLIVALFVRRHELRVLVAKPSDADLRELTQMIETGKVRPVIDRSYSFRQLPDAIRYIETGRARGKVVIDV